MLLPKMKSYFDKSQVADLREKYKLKNRYKQYHLAQQLDLCADFYFRHKRGFDHRQPVKSIRNELDEIAELTHKLKEKLNVHQDPEDLNDGAQYALRQVSRRFAEEAIVKSIEANKSRELPIQSVPLSHGLFAISISMGDEAWKDITFEIDEILTALTHLEKYTSIAKGELKEGARGRRTSHALKNWVSNMEIIWRDFKGGEFSLTRPNGVIKSPAALFTIDALHLIDPDVKEASIANAMRAHNQKRKCKK